MGFGPELSTYQVGAHSEALDEGVLIAVLKFFAFFVISKLGAVLHISSKGAQSRDYTHTLVYS